MNLIRVPLEIGLLGSGIVVREAFLSINFHTFYFK